jgi:hypothetical protein
MLWRTNHFVFWMSLLQVLCKKATLLLMVQWSQFVGTAYAVSNGTSTIFGPPGFVQDPSGCWTLKTHRLVYSKLAPVGSPFLNLLHTSPYCGSLLNWWLPRSSIKQFIQSCQCVTLGNPYKHFPWTSFSWWKSPAKQRSIHCTFCWSFPLCT